MYSLHYTHYIAFLTFNDSLYCSLNIAFIKLHLPYCIYSIAFITWHCIFYMSLNFCTLYIELVVVVNILDVVYIINTLYIVNVVNVLHFSLSTMSLMTSTQSPKSVQSFLGTKFCFRTFLTHIFTNYGNLNIEMTNFHINLSNISTFMLILS